MNRATRIALVTGEMSDCMAPAGRAGGRGARGGAGRGAHDPRARPEPRAGPAPHPQCSVPGTGARRSAARPPMLPAAARGIRPPGAAPGPRSCAHRARRPRGWAGGAGGAGGGRAGAAAMGEDADADGGEEAARPASPRKLGRRRDGGRAVTGGSPAPRGAARGRLRAAGGAGRRRGGARGEGLRRGWGGDARRRPGEGEPRAPPASARGPLARSQPGQSPSSLSACPPFDPLCPEPPPSPRCWCCHSGGMRGWGRGGAPSSSFRE